MPITIIFQKLEYKLLTLVTPLFFVLQLLSVFTSFAYIQVHYKLDFFMEANNMNPDQTTLMRAV